MRIKRPKEFPVGGHIYKVQQEAKQVLHSHRWAEIDHVDQLVTIDPGLLESRKTQSLIHEDLEAINIIWLDGALSHDQIDALAEAFFQFFASLGIELDWSE